MFTGRARQLTIYFGESDQFHSRSLHAAMLEMLRREGCGGATVTRGIAGFGASSVIHTSAILRLSMDLPIVIAVVDRPERIERITPRVREMAPNALITVADVEVIQSGAPFKEGLPDVRVADVMRREVVTVRPDGSIAEVLNLLLDKDFTALPVVDDRNRVAGIVSDNDLLKRAGVQVTLSLKRATDPDFVRELHKSLSGSALKVSEVMTREVVTIEPEMLLAKAAKLMVERHLKRLPVVDKEGKLVGILGRLDILNTIAAVHLPQWHPEAHSTGSDATVADVMSRSVPAVHESATLEEIFQLLVSSTHKRVVVIDDARRVVGIIADSDLISRVSRENWPGLIELLAARVPIEKISAPARQHIMKLRGRSAKELMTREPITVRQEMPVASALVISAEKATKRLPVVDAEGRLVGIVGRAEMLRALMG